MTDLAVSSGSKLPGKPANGSRTRDAKPKHADVRGIMRGPVIVGVSVVLMFFGALGGWAATAPLVSGAIAPGVVGPDSSRKVIQHLEGGIIKSVLVHLNDHVQAGQLLMTLDPVRAEANLAGQRGQWQRLLITRARLAAEAVEATSWAPPEEVTVAGDADLEGFVAAEQRTFETRQASLNQQAEILQRRIERLDSEIASVRAESDGLRAQLDLISDELSDKQKLLDQQLVSRSDVLALRREQARLQSAIAANDARIAQAGQSIEETRLQALQARESYFEEVAQKTAQVNDSLAQLGQGMVSSGDALERTEIRSPVDGIVLNLPFQTPGQVIRPGESIMEIVPIDDTLVVVARLPPKDIDIVTVGLKAHVSLTPFASRNVLPLNGEVIAVAPDAKVDEKSGQAYYEIRVRIPAEELSKQDKGLYLSPGMPADVTVVTGERTMMHYLFDPVWRSLQSAFVYD